MWFRDGESFKDTMGYEVEGAWFPRVTKIVDIKSKPALMHFFKEMGSFSSAEEVKNKSAEEGSRVHETIQQFCTGGLAEIPQDLEHVVSSFESFNKERGIELHPDFVERRIWSREHRYAGTIDGLASIGGKFGVLDIKTSTGFFREYNLQTAAYVLALREASVKQAIGLPYEIETRWILRIDQNQTCVRCGATLRTKGGREKIRNPANGGTGGNGNGNGSAANCPAGEHEWGEVCAQIELKEFPYMAEDIRAFLAAKTLWEWENSYWLRTIGYL